MSTPGFLKIKFDDKKVLKGMNKLIDSLVTRIKSKMWFVFN